MKIAVVGAGIVGITTAYELASDGHQVTVFEKYSSVAESGSFATGSILAPSLTQPFSHGPWPHTSKWAGALAVLRLVPAAELINPVLWHWLRKWTAKVPEQQFFDRFAAACELLLLSTEGVRRICQTHQIEFEQAAGQLVLLLPESTTKGSDAKLALLKSLGVVHQYIDGELISKTEPSLHHTGGMARAVLFPADGVGNCRQFAQLLKEKCVELGVRFQFNASVKSVQSAPAIGLTIANQSNVTGFDRVVLCTGQGWAELAAPLKVKVPGITVQSYSLSAQMRESLNGPRSAFSDSSKNISIARLGNRIRATGGLHFGKPTPKAEKKAQSVLFEALQHFFPGAASMSSSTQFWRGSTFITPDALPLIGESTCNGVFLNVGHGFNGWAMACGSARVLADTLTSGTVDDKAAPFSPRRFGH